MTVRELIEMLQRVNNPEAKVYLEDVTSPYFCQPIVVDVVVVDGDVLITNEAPGGIHG